MIVSEKQPLKLKKKSSHSPLEQAQQRRNLGERGEQLAVSFLISKKFQILGQNIRVGRGEIDIIALDPETREVVFVEVKTRSGVYAGSPSLAIDRRKLMALIVSARRWLREVWKRPGAFRIDVIAKSPGKLNHYRNVTFELL